MEPEWGGGEEEARSGGGGGGGGGGGEEWGEEDGIHYQVAEVVLRSSEHCKKMVLLTSGFFVKNSNRGGELTRNNKFPHLYNHLQSISKL